MNICQIDLFDYLASIERPAESVIDYFHEAQSIGTHRRNEAGYTGDKRSEHQIRELNDRVYEVFNAWQRGEMGEDAARDAFHDIIVSLWCIKVRGEVCRSLFWQKQAPKEYTPAIDNDVLARIPHQLRLPDDPFLLVFYRYREEADYQGHSVVYYRYSDNRWYHAGIAYDVGKAKWSKTDVRCLWGQQLRADEPDQWWTEEGFRFAKESNRLDPQIAAVWCNYIRFIGRDEALSRLGLPTVGV